LIGQPRRRTVAPTAKSWRCRVKLHTWRKAFTPDNEMYLECVRCRKMDEMGVMHTPLS